MNIVQNQLIRWIETHTVSDIVILTDEKIRQLYNPEDPRQVSKEEQK